MPFPCFRVRNAFTVQVHPESRDSGVLSLRTRGFHESRLQDPRCYSTDVNLRAERKLGGRRKPWPHNGCGSECRIALESFMPLLQRAERYFEFAALGTNWKTECLAGVTTFMTMAYIIFVNPSILHEAGMPVAGVTAATCLAAAIGSLLMGVLARYPIALAPGMGLNAYFTYSVVKGMGIDWHVALGAVFLSGIAFLLLTAARRAADDR